MNTEENTSVESTEQTTWNNVTDDVSLSDYGEESNETTESHEEPSEVDSSNEPVTDTNDDEDYQYVVEVDGEEYTTDQISQWKNDSDNKNAWTSKNTQTAQNLASLNNLSNELANNEGFRDHLKDYFSDDQEKLNKINFDNMSGLGIEQEEKEMAPSVLEQKVDLLGQEMRNVAIDRRQMEIENQLDDLERNNPTLLGDENATLDLLKFATDKGYTDVHSAFKDWSFPKMQEQLKTAKGFAKNKNRNEGKVVNTSNAGSKGSVQTKKYKSWKEINAKDPEIKKYFE